MNPTLPPHSIDAETGVIGCLLIEPNTAHDCLTARVTPDWFYSLPHRILYTQIQAMVSERLPVDLITLGQRLRDSQQLEGIGGLSFLSAAIDSVPSAANLPTYIDILRDKTAQRRIVAACAATVQDLSAGIAPDIARIESAVVDARNIGTPAQGGIVSAKTACFAFNEWLHERTENRGKISGVPTGIHQLDKLLDGIQYAELTLIAARPSVGKTALGCCVSSAAVEANVPTLFVTAEMSNRMIIRRIIANRASVSMTDMRRGVLDDSQCRRILLATSVIAKSPLFFEEQMGGVTIGKLLATIRTAIREHGVRFVVIDYIQKFRGDLQREKLTEEIGEVCGKLQLIARETRVAIVALAQLNRENEKEKKTRTPKLTDLGDSKQLEQDADTVIAIHRDRSQTSGEADLCIIKQRDGECGTVKCHYEGQYCRFANLETRMDD